MKNESTTPKNVKIGELTFDYRTSGQEGNELVIFLHGFPETSFMWIKLMDQLASDGFHCIAPDMRGYSKNACPKGVENYTIDKLRDDILHMADHFNAEKFHLVGHDWGAVLGWYIVFNHPDRIISWSALSVPHNKAFAKAYRTDPVQKKKSKYIGWFMVRYLPEFMIKRKDFKVFRRLWKNSSPEELENYLSVFRRKGALTATLNYYRANIGKGKFPKIGDIPTPTLFIWGRYDLAIGEVAALSNEKYMTGDHQFIAVEGGHWLIQTNYDEVAAAITTHLSRYRNINDRNGLP